MEAHRRFTGRKEHRQGGRDHFAEVTVRAEPCLGESEVVLSEEVLDTLRELFGTDFEHHRHCVWAAVSVEISSIDVKGYYPHAGAASFRAEVVGVRVSGNAGRELSGFLLTGAGMDAISEYLTAWEQEQGPPIGRASFASLGTEDSRAGDALPSDYECAWNIRDSLTEEDLRCAVYQTTYVLVRNALNEGLTEAGIRERYGSQTHTSTGHAEMAREALDDALAGLPMRYKSRF